jgi:two-component system, cell cycle sensor histidine kinase and response regulator CckA
MKKETSQLQKRRVYVVEDEALVAGDIQRRLKKLGHEVAGWSLSGEEALSSVENSGADLILMDIILDGEMDGVEAARKMQEEHNLPVVFLTSHADRSTLDRARETSPYGYIIKPFDERELQVTLDMAFQRYSMDQELRKVERWLATTLRSIGEGVLSFDLEGKVTFLNEMAEKMTSWKKKKALGTHYTKVLRLVDEHECVREDLLETMLQLKKVLPLESAMELVNLEAKHIPIGGNISPILNEQAEVTGVVVAFRDLTEEREREVERKEMEERIQLGQRLESLGALTGGIGHDFNNMLFGIMGNLSLAIELAVTPEQKEMLKDAKTASHQATDLCRQMMSYAGRGNFVKKDFELGQMIHDTLQLLPSASKRSVKVEVKLSREKIYLRADYSQLQQVLMNLVVNAFESISDKLGEVVITTGVVDATLRRAEFVWSAGLPEIGQAYLEVQDTGGGIEPENYQKIFEPFFSTKSCCRGLGLSTVLGIVRRHNGALGFSSSMGKGSIFRLQIPAQIPPKDEEIEIGAEQPNVLGRARKILVIDDNELILRTTGRILEKAGYEVVLVSNPHEGIKHYVTASAEIDLVVFGYIMEGMELKEAYDWLCQIEKDVKVLVMSGYAEGEIFSATEYKKNIGFIQKPFAAEALREAVGALVK